MEPSLEARARIFAALGEPVRLAIVEDLATTDRSPNELAGRLGVPSNLLAHHLDVLESVGLIQRCSSAGDRRRRYIRLSRPPLVDLPRRADATPSTVLFVCSHNSARSQLAAALWNARPDGSARSAGTHPARRVHPGAVAAARRAGLDLSGAAPSPLWNTDEADLVVTVCDRAHEELHPAPTWLHWSVPDPVEVGTADAFDAVVAELDSRIHSIT